MAPDGPHQHVMNLMAELGYRSDLEGMCYVLSLEAIIKMVDGDFDTFFQQLQVVKKASQPFQKKLTEIINTLQQKSLKVSLTHYEMIVLKTPDFFKKLEDYHAAFLNDQTHLAIQNSNLIKGPSFSAPYNPHELSACFALYRDVIWDLKSQGFLFKKQIAFMFSNKVHTFAVNYNQFDDIWNIFNISTIDLHQPHPVLFSSCDKIATEAVKASTYNNQSILFTEIFGAKTDQEVLNMFVDRVSKENYWHYLHRVISPEKMYLRDSDGSFWLLIAAAYNDIAVVEQMIKIGSNLNLTSYDDGCTALYMATQNNHVQIVDLLLKAGANPNIACTDDGYTPLIAAVTEGYIEIIKLLINAGVDLDLQDQEGDTALSTALDHYDREHEIVILLQEAHGYSLYQNQNNYYYNFGI